LKQESLTLAGHVASGFTVGISGATKMGWFEFISANASGISIILGCCSLFCAICFYVVSYIKLSQADKNTIEIEVIKEVHKHDHDKLTQGMTSMSSDMHEIKNLLISKGGSNERKPKRIQKPRNTQV